jgi:Family of unknown function (DUF5317)
MLLVLVVALCFLMVPVMGGQITRLAELEVRAVWAALAGIAIQVLIVSLVTGGPRSIHVVLHIASYGLGAYFVVVNRKIPGLWLIGIGGALNFAAIAANGGVMPASRDALLRAGIEPSHGFANSAAVAHPKLLLLGDVFAVPGPWPIGNVFSIGDLVLVAGLMVLIHRTCRTHVRLSGPPQSPS